MATTQYTDDVVTGMQMLYGEGFLSPGGIDEVNFMFKGMDLTGKRILDVGCGLGGCSIMLVKEFGAAHVDGVDVEPSLIERARKAAENAGVAHQVNFQTIEPGPILKDDQSYDIVITKDVVCHIPTKVDFFKEVCRVLKPGGLYLCADFFDGRIESGEEGTAHYDAYQSGMAAYGLTFHFEPQRHYEDTMKDAGLSIDEIVDHTDASANVAARELAYLIGENGPALADILGHERFENRKIASAMRAKALEERGLRHNHIHAQRSME